MFKKPLSYTNVHVLITSKETPKKKFHTITCKSSFKKCRSLKFLDKDNKFIFGYSHM